MWTVNEIMRFAVARCGLSDYTADDSNFASVIAPLIVDKWVERREQTVTLPVDKRIDDAGFLGKSDRTVTLVTYHATEHGKAEWASGATENAS